LTLEEYIYTIVSRIIKLNNKIYNYRKDHKQNFKDQNKYS